MLGRSIVLALTTTSLAAGAVYTSDWIRVWGPDAGDAALTDMAIPHDKLRILGHSYADVASAINGVVIQQSYDGTNVSHTFAFSALALTNETWNVMVFNKHVRISYTNGAVAQTAFTLVARLVEEI